MRIMNFEQAYTRLQEIHLEIQRGELIDIDKILLLQQEAKKLYTICKEKLHSSQQQMQENEKKSDSF